MKKTVLITIIFVTLNCLHAQVGVKRSNVSSVSAILDFPTGSIKGIVLPAVTSAASVTPVNGMIIFDRNDQRLKYYQNNAWVFISDTGNATRAPSPNPSADPAGKGVVISDTTKDNVVGVLELRSNTKAMVLPKVANPHTSIPSPVAGTMVYDTVSQSVALFDGLVWNFLVED